MLGSDTVYFNDVIIKPLFKNIALVSNRNTGKTSTLKKFMVMYRNAGYKVIVIDSATEHQSKSLAKYIEINFDDVLMVQSPEICQIIRSTLLLEDKLDIREVYPFDLFKQKDKSMIAVVDVAKYLEAGYDTEDMIERAKLRLYYKELALQVLCVVERKFGDAKVAVIMDEIELIPEMEPIIKKLNNSLKKNN